MLLSFDGTLLAQILNFVLFWILLDYVFIGPTRRAIEARQRYIATQQREADELAAQAKGLRVQADDILDEARRTTDEALRAASAQASDQARVIERKAAEEAGAIVALADATVAGERSQAVAKQAPFVEELARTMATRALDGEAVA
ncbi:MAG: ATP synthase F0 subunit B [Candidatus Eremiobacteraeota bacterium]|nr:ATP synthase F0 subunit B [Candidatus Eremiobacteraeota bacterium]MBV8366750.1 ATP synthase F0 subunit B [Candidatus Eremiobacteraeota bacterium]